MYQLKHKQQTHCKTNTYIPCYVQYLKSNVYLFYYVVKFSERSNRFLLYFGGLNDVSPLKMFPIRKKVDICT